jgi:predicted Zn-dependent protease
MKGKFLLIFVIFCSISCEPSQEFKGEDIPGQIYISSLLRNEKVQNQKTIAYLNQIIEEGSPSHLYYLRAKYLFESRQYKKANPDIQRSLKLSPRDFDYILLAGQIAFNLEKYTTALNYFNLIKSNEKNQPLIFFLLAEVSLKLNHHKLANYYLSQIKKSGLSDKDQYYFTVLSNLCLMNEIPMINLVGNFYNKSIQDNRLQQIYFENAMEYTSKYTYQNQLLKSINEYPNDPHLLRFWARFLSKINQFKLAELNYLKVINLFEHNDYLFLEIGKFYLSHRYYSKALIYFNKIKPDLEFFIDVPFLKSKCYLYLGDNLHAKSMIDSVKLLLKNDNRFYQLKTKHFGISVDSNLVVKDSLLTIRP